MSALRNKIFGAVVRRETKDIEGVGPVEFRGLTAGAKGRILNAARREDQSIDAERYYPALLIESAHDPETGDKLFTPADRDAINDLPADLVEAMAAAVGEVSGTDIPSAVLEKNSATTPSDGTASGSPSASA